MFCCVLWLGSAAFTNTSGWLGRSTQQWMRRSCLETLGPGVRYWHSALLIGIYPGASARRHVISPSYKNNISVKITLLAILQWPQCPWIYNNEYKYIYSIYQDLTIQPQQSKSLRNKTSLYAYFMITSSNGNIFRVTGPLCGEFTGRSPVNSPHKSQWRGALMFSLICAWTNDRVNNRDAGNLRRHRPHYDVIVILCDMLASFCKKTIVCGSVRSLLWQQAIDWSCLPGNHMRRSI